MTNAWRLNPQDRLEPGTAVQVGNRRGVVVKCEEVSASNSGGGWVMLHTFKFTERFSHRLAGRSIWEPLAKPVTAQANYSHVLVLGKAAV